MSFGAPRDANGRTTRNKKEAQLQANGGEQEAQRERARERLRQALELVLAAEQEVRRWAPLSVMNDFTAIEAELRTVLARL